MHPVRDMFAAVFFVSVGMLIEPAVIGQYLAFDHRADVGGGEWQDHRRHAGRVLDRSRGADVRAVGMSLAQIGEFSFIIAGLGLSLKATGSFLYPIAVAVSALTTLTTPWLIRASGPVANFVD